MDNQKYGTFEKIFFGALSIITLSLVRGYTFMKFWEWFVVYAFGVQPLNLLQAIGIAYFSVYLTSKRKEDAELNWDVFEKQFVDTLIWFGIVLGSGYLITLFQ